MSLNYKRVPRPLTREDLQAAIWAVGLKQDFREDVTMRITKFLSDIGKELKYRFSMIAGPLNHMNESLN